MNTTRPGHRFFAFVGDGFETYASEAEARDAASEAIDAYRDYCGDGWDEEVEQVCWGRIEAVSVQTQRRGHDPECRRGEHCRESGCYDTHGVPVEFDYMCEYELKRVWPALTWDNGRRLHLNGNFVAGIEHPQTGPNAGRYRFAAWPVGEPTRTVEGEWMDDFDEAIRAAEAKALELNEVTR